MKGLSDCHVANDQYRENYQLVFGKQSTTCAGCGLPITVDEQSPESLCPSCTTQLKEQDVSWEG